MRQEAGLTREWTERPIAGERLAILRTEVRNRSLSFPAQIPAFGHEECWDVQRRVVALYFVRGWSCDQLASRYCLTPGRIRQVLRQWVTRAATLGYLQRIPPAPVAPIMHADRVWIPSVAIPRAIALQATAGRQTPNASRAD